MTSPTRSMRRLMRGNSTDRRRDTNTHTYIYTLYTYNNCVVESEDRFCTGSRNMAATILVVASVNYHSFLSNLLFLVPITFDHL